MSDQLSCWFFLTEEKIKKQIKERRNNQFVISKIHKEVVMIQSVPEVKEVTILKYNRFMSILQEQVESKYHIAIKQMDILIDKLTAEESTLIKSEEFKVLRGYISEIKDIKWITETKDYEFFFDLKD